MIYELTYNLLLMLASFGYGLGVLAIGRGLQLRLQKPASFTRKIIHLFAGYSSFVVFWFTPAYSWLAIIIGVSFTALLFLARPTGPLHGIFDSMAREDDVRVGGLEGPLYYAASLTVLTTIFTLPFLPQLHPYFWVPANCLAMMFVGDGIAPIVGKRWGRHRYGKYNRSIEGSLAVLAGGFAGCVLTLLLAKFISITQLLPEPFYLLILIGLGISAPNTGIEAISPSGYDNVTCPFITTLVFSIVVIFMRM
jgi:dolichol kinase